MLKRHSRRPNQFRTYLIILVTAKCQRNFNTFSHYSLDFTSNWKANDSFMEKFIPYFYCSSSNFPVQWEIQFIARDFKVKFHKLIEFLHVYLSKSCNDHAHSTGVPHTFQILCQYYKVAAQASRINSVQA